MALLVRNRNYRLLVSASALSNLADGISLLAFPWLATLITRDPVLISLVAFATSLPWLVVGIPAGVITDRGDRRVLMVQADVFRFLVTLGVIALILNLPEVPLNDDALVYILALAGLAFLLGTAEVIRDNAAQTMLPAVVEKADLEAANGQLGSVEQVMGAFIGPPLAGLLIAVAVPVPFLVDAVVFALAGWCVWCMAVPPRIQPVRRKVWHEIIEGWRWMRAHPIILRLAIMLGLINLVSVMGLTLLVLYSQEILGLDAVGHGILMISAAAGGVVAGLVSPAVIARIGPQRAIYLALALFPLPFVIIALVSNPWLVAVALFIEMAGAMLWNIVTVSYRQRRIPDDLLGRVNSLYRFFGWGLMPVGALAGGLLVAVFEPALGREAALRLPYMAGAVGFVLVGVYGWKRLKL